MSTLFILEFAFTVLIAVAIPGINNRYDTLREAIEWPQSDMDIRGFHTLFSIRDNYIYCVCYLVYNNNLLLVLVLWLSPGIGQYL